MPLSDDDRNLVHRAFANGPASLTEVGIPLGEIATFLVRPDVQEEWLVLTMEYRGQHTLTATRKFMILRQLSRFAEGAAYVMGRGLAGNQYARDANGNIERDARGFPIITDVEISPVQLRSAEGILDRLGVTATGRHEQSAAIATTETLFKQLSDVESRYKDDPLLVTEEQRAISRERVRNMILRLSPKVVEARARVIAELEHKPKARKKKARPNARKKKTRRNKT